MKDKQAIASLFQRGTTVKETNHRAGRLLHYADYYDADVIQPKNIRDIQNYDVVYLYGLPEDVDREDNITVFGGIDNEKNKEQFLLNISEIEKFSGELYQLDAPFRYSTAYKRRQLVLDEKMDNLPLKQMFEDIGRPFGLGDSHVTSVTPWKWRLYNYDGSTLYGVLKSGLHTLIPDPRTDECVINFGNIDFRHHLCRQADPVQSTMELAEEYVKQVKDLNLFATITAIMPMTSDDRGVPTTGFYKGSPFYGDLELRKDLINRFNDYITSNYDRVLTWSSDYYTEEGLLNEDKMERPRSVHLAPHSYNKEWNAK